MEPHESLIENFENEKNSFITGGAGVGKSYNLGKFISWADENEINVARTALTGMASIQLSMGETLHRCLGIGFNKNKDDLKKVVRSYNFSRETKWELMSLEGLIVDEISMLRSDTLELCNEVLKYARDSEEPFGGLPTIFSGDFMQLPPIVKPEERQEFKERGQWAFQSDVWNELDLNIHYLTEIKRQNDRKFAMALNMIRAGAVNEAVNDYFYNSATHSFPEGITPVKLLSTNYEVNKTNENQLKKIKEKEEKYDAEIRGITDKLKDRIKRDCPAMEQLNLKHGAQVMVLINDKKRRFVNGSMGEYLGMRKVKIDTSEGIQKVDAAEIRLFENDELVYLPKYEWKIEKKKEDKGKFTTTKLASFKQFPIKLAWAITIHKSQGMSIDYLQVDLTRCFSPGMAYVALSRARNYEGLRVINWNPRIVNCDKQAFEFYMDLKKRGEI